MAKLTVDQQTILDLFSNKKSDFLIPDYQRPYEWTESECQTLWDDLFSFSFPENDCSLFKRDDEYFLGPIVTFTNDDEKKEIIDGQQRLTTLLLLLRAFYSKFDKMKDAASLSTKSEIEKCIWKTDEFKKADFDHLKIDSEVATDEDKKVFLNILKTGLGPDVNKSNYTINYNFFVNKIDSFLGDYPSYFAYFPTRILNNCILLPIEAESQDTALRIFSTLNDRGKPLSDSDIFKSRLYNFYTSIYKKEEFINQWKYIDAICNRIFHPIIGTPMDELFTRYMYYERAKQGKKSSTTAALRKFYEDNNYELFKTENTFDNLILLCEFWQDIENQNKQRFSDEVLRLLFVLNYAPNGMWTYIVSVYFMHNKDENGLLDNGRFASFLNIITAFIFAYALTNPGVNALRTPIFAEMINIVNGLDVDFADYKFDTIYLSNVIDNFRFYNNRPVTKSLLAWWMFHNKEQSLLPLDTSLEIEHIYSRNRQKYESGLTNPDNLESIGNKALLEKRINIRAADYKFADKIKYYEGFTNSKGQKKQGTANCEFLSSLKEKADFLEPDIKSREQQIIESFIEYLSQNDLIQQRA